MTTTEHDETIDTLGHLRIRNVDRLDTRPGSPPGRSAACRRVHGCRRAVRGQSARLFRAPETGKTLGECEDALSNIESATFWVESKKLGGDAAFTALADRKRRKQIGAELAPHRDKDNGDGRDCLLVVDKAGSQLIMHGVSAAAEYSLQTAKTGAASIAQTAELDLAVCRAIVRLPVMREALGSV